MYDPNRTVIENPEADAVVTHPETILIGILKPLHVTLARRAETCEFQKDVHRLLARDLAQIAPGLIRPLESIHRPNSRKTSSCEAPGLGSLSARSTAARS